MAHPLVAFVLLALSLISTGANRFRSIPGTGLFTATDDPKSTYLFHGINIVHKGPDFKPITTAEIAIIKQLGFNLVRFGFLWADVEPSPGNFNETYLQRLEENVNTLWRNGLYVFLDMHQDCFSAYFCAGVDGVPMFYGHPPNTTEYTMNGSKAFPIPFGHLSYVDPQPPGFAPWGYSKWCFNPGLWSMCYPTYALGAAAQRLYNNVDGLQGHMAKMWQQVARAFAGHPAVIGYELINEPWLGEVPLSLNEFDPITNPRYWDLWFPGVSDQRNLAPLYNAVASAIRDVDNDTMIFFEPATGGNFLDTRSGFSHGPGGPTFDATGLNTISYHVYCPLIESDVPIPSNSSWGPIVKWLVEVLELNLCSVLNSGQFKDRLEDLQRIGVGGILSEFGAIPQTEEGIAYMQWVLSEVDDHLQSWTFWEIDDVLSADQRFLSALTRPYPRRVPGVLHRFHNITTSTGASGVHVEYILPSGNLPVNNSLLEAEIFVGNLSCQTSDVLLRAMPPCCLFISHVDCDSGVVTIGHNWTMLEPESIVAVSIVVVYRS